MKLTFKLVFALITLIVLILVVDAYLSVRRESAFLREELQRKAYRIGSAMKELVADTWRRQGPDVALALIHAANERERLLMIRWVWLDDYGSETFRPHAPTDRLGQATLGEPVTLQYRTRDGREFLVTYVGVNVGQHPGALELSEPLSVTDDFVWTSIYRKIALTAIVVLSSIGATLLLGIWLVGWPLKRLIDKARRVSTGDLSEPIELRSRDELSELAETLNQMCQSLSESEQKIRQEAEARIATIEQLRHSDRLRTVGQLSSGVAHELGTPLNVVTGRASLISSGRLAPDAIVESAQIIKSQAERMADIIRQLLDFSRSGKSRRVPVDLMLIVRETTKILNPLSRKQGIELIISEGSKPMSACVDPGQIQQVLTNLVMNAIQATPAGGRVTIGVSLEHLQHASREITIHDYYCLSVEDTGQGIPDEILNRLFEPFVTTKDVGQGTGLGLSIAYGIVQEHGGWIDVKSKLGQGSHFRVYLPEGKQPCQDES
jgi:two-component system, NtrC family, sensor kinase